MSCFSFAEAGNSLKAAPGLYELENSLMAQGAVTLPDTEFCGWPE